MPAGELAEPFPVSKPTMSAHFAILQEAGLVETEKVGRSVIYRLKMSVLEEALLGFAQTLGVGWPDGLPAPSHDPLVKKGRP